MFDRVNSQAGDGVHRDDSKSKPAIAGCLLLASPTPSLILEKDGCIGSLNLGTLHFPRCGIGMAE